MHSYFPNAKQIQDISSQWVYRILLQFLDKNGGREWVLIKANSENFLRLLMWIVGSNALSSAYVGP